MNEIETHESSDAKLSELQTGRRFSVKSHILKRTLDLAMAILPRWKEPNGNLVDQLWFCIDPPAEKWSLYVLGPHEVSLMAQFPLVGQQSGLTSAAWIVNPMVLCELINNPSFRYNDALTFEFTGPALQIASGDVAFKIPAGTAPSGPVGLFNINSEYEVGKACSAREIAEALEFVLKFMDKSEASETSFLGSSSGLIYAGTSRMMSFCACPNLSVELALGGRQSVLALKRILHVLGEDLVQVSLIGNKTSLDCGFAKVLHSRPDEFSRREGAVKRLRSFDPVYSVTMKRSQLRHSLDTVLRRSPNKDEFGRHSPTVTIRIPENGPKINIELTPTLSRTVKLIGPDKPEVISGWKTLGSRPHEIIVRLDDVLRAVKAIKGHDITIDCDKNNVVRLAPEPNESFKTAVLVSSIRLQ